MFAFIKRLQSTSERLQSLTRKQSEQQKPPIEAKSLEVRVKFADVKERLIEVLRSKFGNGDFILMDGFLNSQLLEEQTGSIILGGPFVPMVAVVDKKTFEMSFFAAKGLLPDLRI